GSGRPQATKGAEPRLHAGDRRGTEGAGRPQATAGAVPELSEGDGRGPEGTGRPQATADAGPLRLQGGDRRGDQGVAEGITEARRPSLSTPDVPRGRTWGVVPGQGVTTPLAITTLSSL